jgi:hypothetical protein
LVPEKEAAADVPVVLATEEEEDDEAEEEAEEEEEEEDDDDDAEEEAEVDLDAPEEDKSETNAVPEVDLDEPKVDEAIKSKCDMTESATPSLPQEALPSLQVSGSELTKSLRQVRLNKKTTPVKSPLKEKWQPRNLTPDLEKDEEEIDDDEDDDEEEIDDDEEEEVGAPDSPTLANLSAAGAKGTEVFDFTDDEDIPLSNIDLAALSAGAHDSEGLEVIASSSPVAPLTPRQSPGKSLTARRPVTTQDMSPTVLTSMDAVSAVQALLSPSSAKELPVVKLNGDVLSDDTDNSVGLKALISTEKMKSAKRRKRRVPDSDGGKAAIFLG